MVWQAALILLAGGQVDRVTALGEVRSCFVEKAQQLDDGTSDAITIGRVLASACDDKLVAYATAATFGEKRAARKRAYMLEYLRSDAETPAAIVLQLRAIRRSQ